MSKPRWHPLPIDSQVVAALEDRKEKFIESFKKDKKTLSATQNMVFFHVCTVLEHAKRIFETGEDNLQNLRLEDLDIDD